jgi:hypothetical protein
MNILAYTMGKVGSTTVMRAVQSAGHVVGRGYPGNIHDIYELDLNFYDAFVTMVRDPMARNISQYFETTYSGFLQLEDFTANFQHGYLTWFEDWLQPILGVDVYAETFPKAKGWKVYGNVLVIKTEKLDSALAEGLEALGASGPFTVDHRAYGREKFGDDYARFIKAAKFDSELLDELYDSKMVKHFYLASEIKKFRNRWATE